MYLMTTDDEGTYARGVACVWLLSAAGTYDTDDTYLHTCMRG
jgi:hypothetical protein